MAVSPPSDDEPEDPAPVAAVENPGSQAERVQAALDELVPRYADLLARLAGT